MIESEYIVSIRTTVADLGTPPAYPDAVYKQQISKAVKNLNRKYGTSYIYTLQSTGTLSAITGGFESWVEIYAAIQMCYTRAAAENITPVGDNARTVTVPNLSVTTASDTDGSKIWLKLAAELKKDLEDLETEITYIPTEEEVVDTVMTVFSNTTGRKTQYHADTKPPVPTLDAVFDGDMLTVTWSQYRGIDFDRYELWYSSVPELTDPRLLTTVYDSHSIEHLFAISGVQNDIYVYMRLFNSNNLFSQSQYIFVELG